MTTVSAGAPAGTSTRAVVRSHLVLVFLVVVLVLDAACRIRRQRAEHEARDAEHEQQRVGDHGARCDQSQHRHPHEDRGADREADEREANPSPPPVLRQPARRQVTERERREDDRDDEQHDREEAEERGHRALDVPHRVLGGDDVAIGIEQLHRALEQAVGLIGDAPQVELDRAGLALTRVELRADRDLAREDGRTDRAADEPHRGHRDRLGAPVRRS